MTGLPFTLVYFGSLLAVDFHVLRVMLAFPHFVFFLGGFMFSEKRTLGFRLFYFPWGL